MVSLYRQAKRGKIDPTLFGKLVHCLNSLAGITPEIERPPLTAVKSQIEEMRRDLLAAAERESLRTLSGLVRGYTPPGNGQGCEPRR